MTPWPKQSRNQFLLRLDSSVAFPIHPTNNEGQPVTTPPISTELFRHSAQRRGSDSGKWRYYGEDVLPLWVADMDFASPQPIMDAIHRRVHHGVFGYGGESDELAAIFCQRMADFYNWTITPEDLIFLPGLVCGLNVVSRAVGDPRDGILVNTPVYPPFLSAPTNQGKSLNVAELAVSQEGNHLRYEVDFDAFEAAISPHTRLFLLCNPHNPVGRSYTQDEQLRMAEICARHDMLICSDEIHCDLLLDETAHFPMASLDPEIAQRTITLMAPSKTFNMPGLGCSLAIVQNPQLRAQINRAQAGIVPHVNLLGYSAAVAAYRDCEEWRQALLVHLAAMRDLAAATITAQMPGIHFTLPESTYLMWLDCRQVIEGNPQKFFLENAKVALNDGKSFGQGGEGFVRLNLGTCENVLTQALGQMQEALSALP